jgi:hypothetical protein
VNPYESRRLARRIHTDRARRIELLLVRLAAEGTLSSPPTGGVHKVLAQGYVWCDIHCQIHEARANFYDIDGDSDCMDENWRSVFVASTDPNEEF